MARKASRKTNAKPRAFDEGREPEGRARKTQRPGDGLPEQRTDAKQAVQTGAPGTGAGPLEPRPDGSLPSREQLLRFIAQATGKVGKREIARAFGLKGGARIALKRVLSEMADEGLLAGSVKDLRKRGNLPPVAVLEIFATDPHGDLLARPTVWEDAEGDRPVVRMLSDDKSRPARERLAKVGVGDRVLAHINPIAQADRADEAANVAYTGEAIRRLSREQRSLLGIYRAHHDRPGGFIEPIDKKNLREHAVQKSDTGTAKDGDLVRFELMRAGRQHLPRARVLEALGNPDDQRQISLIAIHTYGLPNEFPESVLAEVEALEPPDVKARADLTGVPLITIDPPDARDHDDAVYAEPDDDPKNPGGFAILVAIADVAHYVRPGTALDREAEKRGNSVYFPDRVVPMLPERISNDLCSLRENEERPCLAVRIVYERDGTKRSHTFMRAIMRSHLKLSYAQAQTAFDGDPDPICEPVLDSALRPLWAAYEMLRKARDERAPLELDLPERKLKLDDDGRVADVVIPERLDAHKLIEEFMIQANVAAAEELEKLAAPVVYRVHDKPSKEKLASLREFLETLDLKVPTSSQLKPKAFNAILEKAKDLPVPELVNEVILRSQSQAEYTPENIGHFGLNLRRYAHFTSPIRRYADLLVHRALIGALGLGAGGLITQDASSEQADSPHREAAATTKGRLARVAKAISEAERRAMSAERETVDRLIAAHLADRVGATFKARISGVTRSGLFVKLAQTGADGFVPISSLGDEFFHHVEESRALIGDRSNLAFTLGDAVDVRLVEAIPSAGALRFEMLSEPRKPRGAPAKGMRHLKPRRRTGRSAPPRRGRRGG